MKNAAFALLLLFYTFVYFGCAVKNQPKTAEELFTVGNAFFEQKDYREAIEYFEKLKDWYPFSQYTAKAEIKIADSFFEREEYEDAVFAYQSFMDMHPTSELIPYALYKMGLCSFDRIDTVDRDQSSARRVFEVFTTLKEEFPQSPYAAKTEEFIQTCLKSLAGHDFYVGVFYYKNKRYESALSRFMSVTKNYPDIDGIHEKALDYINLCKKKTVSKQQ